MPLFTLTNIAHPSEVRVNVTGRDGLTAVVEPRTLNGLVALDISSFHRFSRLCPGLNFDFMR